MTQLKLNREFFARHLFVAVLMLGLGAWFGYDGFVRYPRTDAAALYKSIEGSDAPVGYNLEAFKRQKTQTQHGFAALALLAALAVGGHLLAVSRFRFAFDDAGFELDGRRHAYGEITSVDSSLWQKKGIVTISGDGFRAKLDAWHHAGVKDFAKKILNEDKEKT